MTTTGETQFAKCRCQLCSASIEFPVSDSGRTATCPHCGMETELFVPITATLPLPAVPQRLPWYRSILVKWAVWVSLAALVGWLISRVIIVIQEFGVAKMAGVGVGVGGVVLGVVIAILILIWAVLWIVFPVFVYFGMNRMEKILREIAANTRQP